MRVKITTVIDIDTAAWRAEYSPDSPTELAADVLHDAREWATDVHFAEPKWDGLVTAKLVDVVEVFADTSP